MKKSLLTLAFALATILPLCAEMSSQTNDYSGVPDFSGSLVFDKLNAAAAGWTVTQVVVTSHMEIDGFSLMVTNTSSSSSTLKSYAFGAENEVTVVPLASVTTLVATNAAKPNTVIAPYSSVTVTGTPHQASYTWTITDSSQVSQFLGTGTFNVTYTASQSKTISTTGGTQDTLNPSTSWGSVIVNFFYAIPEPSTWAMIGGAALMLLVLKRKGEDA